MKNIVGNAIGIFLILFCQFKKGGEKTMKEVKALMVFVSLGQFGKLYDVLDFYSTIINESNIIIDVEDLEEFLIKFENEMNSWIEKYGFKNEKELIENNIFDESEIEIIKYLKSMLEDAKKKKYDYLWFCN
jgi:ribosome biogenesis GTPase A